MKHIKFIFVLFLYAQSSSGQAIVIDPVNQATAILNGAEQRKRLDSLKKHQTLIEKAQVLATTNLTFINDVQDKIHKGLTLVSSTLTQGVDLLECGKISSDIIKYQQQMVQNAQGNPLYLAFAEQFQYEFVMRGYGLINYLYNTVIAQKDGLLMDAGDRAKLIQDIRRELSILRGLAYTASRAVWSARAIGFMKALNPYQGYINIDKQIFNEVNSKVKVSY